MSNNDIKIKFSKILDIINSEEYSDCRKSIVIMTTTQELLEEIKIFPTRQVDDIICIPIGIKKVSTAKHIVKYFDGKVEIFFVDVENKLQNCQNILQKIGPLVKNTKIFQIKSNDLTVEYTFALLSNNFLPISKEKILIIGAGNIGAKLALKLIECGANVLIKNSTKTSTKKVANAINILKPKECLNFVIPVFEKIPKINCVISFTNGPIGINSDMINKVKKNGLVIDGGTGTISQDAITLAQKKGLKIMRIDIRKGFEMHAKLIKDTEIFLNEIFGYKKFENFNLVAGGYLGEIGDVVVDEIKNPKKILGISDGKGKFLDDDMEYTENLKIVKKLIHNNQL